MILKKDFIIKVPNTFITNDNVTKEFLATYIMLGRNMNPEGSSYIVCQDILDFSGISQSKNKVIPKEYKNLLATLKHMEANEMLSIKSDLTNHKWYFIIKVQINAEIFSPTKNFTIINMEQFDRLYEIETKTKKNVLLIVFLYILSNIRTKKNCPHAFFRSLQKMSEDLSISYPVVVQVMKELSTGEHPLLKKKTMSKNSKYPNIYVLNQNGWEKEMEYAVNYVNELKEND